MEAANLRAMFRDPVSTRCAAPTRVVSTILWSANILTAAWEAAVESAAFRPVAPTRARPAARPMTAATICSTAVPAPKVSPVLRGTARGLSARPRAVEMCAVTTAAGDPAAIARPARLVRQVDSASRVPPTASASSAETTAATGRADSASQARSAPPAAFAATVPPVVRGRSAGTTGAVVPAVFAASVSGAIPWACASASPSASTRSAETMAVADYAAVAGPVSSVVPAASVCRRADRRSSLKESM